MKLLLFLSLFFSIYAMRGQVCHGTKVLMTQNGGCTGTNLSLVFEDNFDGDSLDRIKWHFTQPWGNHSEDGFNASLEYQTDGLNYEFKDGTLKLLIRKEKFLAKAVQWLDSSYLLKDDAPNKRWWDYTAGMIYSKEEFGYGKYEIRCKIPKGKGFWSVFWLYGKNEDEIDVFEFWNEENIFGNYSEKKLSTRGNMTSHANGVMCLNEYSGEDFSKGFHTFTFIWNNNKMCWYVDGELKRTSYKFYTLLGQPLDCEQINEGSIYILNKAYPLGKLNISVSLGIQPGKNAPDDSTPFPSCIEIDYVRFWEYK